jgi:hypothetical protein
MGGAGVLLAVLAGCTGAPEAPPASPTPDLAEAPVELVDATWVVASAPEEAIGAYASKPGWISLVMKRDYAEAVRALGPLGGLAAARAHTEAATLYRQAALISAYGLIEVYGKTPEPTDPVGTAHLLAVSYAVTGDLAHAREASDRLAGVTDDPVLPWHAPWRSWLAAGGEWPPDLSGLPLELPAPTAGAWPEVTDLPHYSLPELAGSTASRDMADPSALIALALWHDTVAEQAVAEQAVAEQAVADGAAPDLVPALKTLRAGYRLPAEPPPPAAGPLPPELLFGADLLVPGDAAFLADLEGPSGMSAIEAHTDTSLLAWLVARSRVDGKLDAELAIDHLGQLRRRLVARSAEIGGGEQSHHRTLADVAHVGGMRALSLVAERAGDRETSGLLRIGAYERSDKAAACPVGLLALAAWDASNRYPMRAQDILHAQAKRYPSLEVARYGLDVLGLRVGSERIGETAGM